METDFSDEPGWFCDGGPHRAVQNQVFCRTGRPRRTVRYRKRPCGVREAHLSAWAARGGGSSAGCHVERMTGASGSRWRSNGAGAADAHEGEVAAEQMRCKPDSSDGRQVPGNEQNNDLSCLVLPTGKVLFCLIISVLSATAGGAARAARRSGSEMSQTSKQRRRPAKAPPEPACP